MIVDTSAVVAVLRNEPEARMFTEAISRDLRPRMSAASYLETALVIDGGHDPVASRELDRYLEIVRLEVVPVAVRHAGIARQAHRDFGRGSGHRARLNLGDCFAYALAVDTGEPLLFKGDDFGHTDVTPAVGP